MSGRIEFNTSVLLKTEWTLYSVFYGAVFKNSNGSETAMESISIHKLAIFVVSLSTC